MKNCYICGTENFLTNAYCIHCGNKMTGENICPNCGKINDDSSRQCAYCSQKLKPVNIASFDDLFSLENLQLISSCQLTDETYARILRTVFDRARHARIDGKTAKERILALCQVFAQCIPKSRDGIYGHNFGNVIIYDERLDDSAQIATLLHELGHCILFNIMSNLLCEILRVNPSPYVYSFVWFMLSNDEMLLLNEHCASTVSARFVPFGFQDYGSFKHELSQADIEEESLIDIIRLSVNFSNEICAWLSEYIGSDLIESIKIQFRYDQKAKNPDAFEYEIFNEFDMDEKHARVMEYILRYFVLFVQYPEFREDMESTLNLF